MEKLKYSVLLFWDKVSLKDDRKARVMMIVSLGGKSFRMVTGIRCAKAEFERAYRGRGGDEEVRELRRALFAVIDKAEGILGKVPGITKEKFLKFFKVNINLSESEKVDALKFFQMKLDSLESENKFGAAVILKCAYRSFKAFREPLFFEDIDRDLMLQYKGWMERKGNSPTTTGMYMRALRTLYNAAVKDKMIVDKEPFKDIKLKKGKSTSVLYPEQIKALWEFKPIGVMQTRAKDMFFFCYLCNGMNFKDAALIRHGDIRNGILTFIRSKTSTTNREPKVIKVYLHDEVKRIIERWGSKNAKSSDFLFSFMSIAKDPRHINSVLIRYKRCANTQLNRIGEELGFDVRLNLALARHSFATKHKLSGTPVSFISEAMGHSSVAVTEHYLKNLPDENLKVMSDSLLQF